MKTLMLVPATTDVDVKYLLPNLANQLSKKNISSVFITIDPDELEQFLVTKNQDKFLQEFFATCEKLGKNKDILIIGGLSYDKIYALNLNLTIVQALDSFVIFNLSSQYYAKNNLTTKIAMSDYADDRIIGIIANENSASFNLEYTNKICRTMKLPLLGICCDNVLDVVNIDPIVQLTEINFIPSLTPTKFQNYLFSKARSSVKKIVLPEGKDPRIIKAANICATLNLVKPVLIGNEVEIENICRQQNLVLDDRIEIVDTTPQNELYVNTLWELRKHKGLTRETAIQQLQNVVMRGIMMLYLGEADGLVAGAAHTTADTVRPALQIIKTADTKLVSSIFFMCLPDQVLIYGDCAINPNPNSIELADIAIQSAKTAESFGLNPKIAMLSYSTVNSGIGSSVDRVNEAVTMVKKLAPHLVVDGPLQYDAAVDPVVAKLKVPDSFVAGKATVLIFPNLDAGNIAYKAVQRSTHTISMGPILQGLRKPVNDLSRGCSVDDIVATIVITAIQAME